MKNRIIDINIRNYEKLISPAELSSLLPSSEKAKQTVLTGRKNIEDILSGLDLRKMIIVGPCSIHSYNESLDYAKKLKELSDKVDEKLLIVMRTYFEKPRTIMGWKGLIYDPDLNDSFDIEKGLKIARKLLLNIAEIELPTGTEFLEPIIPQYIADLISWASIGARTSESQIHRQMASGLSMPVGYKNSTLGDVGIAINAMKASRNHHSFIGVDKFGRVSKINTRGNKYCHLILRGGEIGPNYRKEQVKNVQDLLERQDLSKKLVIDCSHGNSGWDYKKQPQVFYDVVNQIKEKNNNIMGLMLESNLKEGNQKFTPGSKFKKGVSLTDSCIGWNTTEKIILDVYEKL